MKLTDKTKTYIKWALVGLLIFFSLNRCTVACNRGRELKRFETSSSLTISGQQEQMDSVVFVVDSLEGVITLLRKDTAYLHQNINDLEAKNTVLVEKSTKQQVVHNHYSDK